MKTLLLLLAPLAAAAPSAPAPAPGYGILLLAHGGDAAWDKEIAALREQVDARVPTEAALGMADPAALQAAADRLKARGVSRIAAVPLFVQSRSEVMDQTRYVLGLADKPSEPLRAALERIGAEHAKAMAAAASAGGGPHAAHAGMAHAHAFSTARVKSVPIVLARALDDDPLVARVLLDRAKALSRAPARETVVLVAHGPVDDAALPAWDATLRLLGERVRAGGGFRAARAGVLRDDAEPAVRAAAVASLRRTVEEAGKSGRVLVVPVLIARGGIEGKIEKDLAGLDYAWDGSTLMPHPGFADWVLRRAAEAASSR